MPRNYDRTLLLVLLLILSNTLPAQVKILFDATKAESAANADWVIDADLFNIGYTNGPPVVGQGNESNPQRYPTPAQSTVTQSTAENYWKGAISAWGIECVKKGYQLETLPYNGQITYGNTSNAQDLSNYKVFIVDEPNILFTTAEKTAIMQFIQDGGGLFMVSDHTVSDRNNDGHDSPEIWNDLMSNNSVQSNPFGLTFDLANFSQTTSNIPNLPSDPLLHGTMGNVTQAQWSAGTSITLSPSANSSVTGVVYKTGSSFGNSNVMVAHATFGSGKVVAFGDSSPCDDGTGDSNDQLYDGWLGDANGNHKTLIMNATIWLAATSGSAPAVTTLAATGVTTTAATLNGSVNPNGLATNYWFQWGTTTGYGNTTSSAAAGSGSSAVSVNAGISGLTPGTTYHFRLVAQNSAGTSNGNDLSFTTQAATLSVSPSNQNVADPAGSTSFTVNSNSAWTASSNQSWCTVTPSGTGNGTILASYSQNTGTTQRVASITVTVTGLPPVVVTVTQSGAAATLSVTPPNQNVTAPAGSTSFTVTSNSAWTAASSQTWCTVTPAGNGNGTITAGYTENTSLTQRVASITVTVNGLNPVVVTVTQSGAAATLSVTPLNQGVTAPAGNTSFTVTSNSAWTAASDQAWCTVTPSGNGNGTITAGYTENTSLTQRVANITVTVNGLNPVVVTVTQSGAAATLSVTPPNQNVTSPAGNTSFTVTSNSAWTAASDQAWCTVTPSGTGNGSIAAAFEANNSVAARVATIQVAVAGLNPVTVTVSQAGAPALLLVTPPDRTVSAASGSTTFSVVSNTGWSCSTDADWCTITSFGSGDGTITADYAENTGDARTASIQVTAAGAATQVVTVHQLPFVNTTGDLTGSGILLYPNPTTGNFLVKWQGEPGRQPEITVTDATGNVIHPLHFTDESGISIGLAGYTRGIYLVKLEVGSKSLVSRLVLQ